MSSTPTPPTRRDDPRMRTVEMAAVGLEDPVRAEVLGSGPVQPTLPVLQTAALVAAGGALGTALRVLATLVDPAITTPTLVEIPWATFWVNLLGCLGLGALTGVLEVRRAAGWMQPLLGTGLCGGFTTMSTVVLEGSAMLGADFPFAAFTYAALTTLLCLTAVAAGLLGGRRLGAHRLRRTLRRAGTVSTPEER